MLRGITLTLRVATLFVVASGFFALVTTYSFPPIMLAVPLGLFILMPFGERLDLLYRGYRRMTFWLTVAFLLSIPALFLLLGLLGCVISVVVYIIGFALLHRKTEREYFHLYLMSFFLLLAACMMSPEPSISLVMALFLVSLVVGMMMLQLEIGLRDRSAILPELLPMAQREYLPARNRDYGFRRIPVMVGAVALAAFLITGALFVLTPRMEAGLLGRGDPDVTRTGRSQRVDLAQGGTILRDQTPVMRVEFPDEPGGQYSGPLFWRCATLPEFDAPEWKRLNISPHDSQPAFALSAKRIRPGYVRGEIGRDPLEGRRTVRQRISMNEVPVDGLPALTLVQQCVLQSTAQRGMALTWDPNSDFTLILTRRASTQWLEYEAVSEIEAFTPSELAKAPDNYGDILAERDYRLLTANPFGPEMRRQVAEIMEGSRTVYERVAAVLDYLNSGEFRYTRAVPELPEDHPVEAFLNVTKRGHCELFASAMALMLRSAGIPARVVSGYRGGEWSQTDRAYIVRADSAHLWVEVFFLDVGWVTFDPSPADDVDLGAISQFRRTLSRYVLKAKIAWYRDVVSFNRGVQIRAIRNFTLGIIGFTTGIIERLASSAYNATPAVAGSLAVAVLAAAAAIVLIAGRRTRDSLTPEQRRAVRLYHRLLRRLSKRGIPCRNRTAEEIAAAASGYPELAGITADAIAVYNRVRFGGRTLERSQWKALGKGIQRL